MTDSKEKAALLEQMGIPQWLRRSTTEHSEASALVVDEIGDAISQPQVASSTDTTNVLLSGNAASGWLWLLDKPISADVQGLLTDIQRSVGCKDGGLMAYPDAGTDSSAKPLAASIESELITRLVIFGNSQFQLDISAELTQAAVASVKTLPLEELQTSAAAKRQLWTELKNLLLS